MTEPVLLLTAEHLQYICQRVGFVVRDAGLLSSASMRPATSVFGVEVYQDLDTKAAAVMHSIVAHHPLVDGNKRLGWLALILTLDVNDVRLDIPDDDAVEFTIRVAAGKAELEDIVDQIRAWRAAV